MVTSNRSEYFLLLHQRLMSFCIVNGTEPNIILSASANQDKTIDQIMKDIKVVDSVLAIRTPYYTEVLQDGDIPLTKYPSIIYKENIPAYPPPEFYLKVLPKSEINNIWIEVKVQTQLKDEIPTMPVPFNKKELKKQSVADILMCCKAAFGYECTEANLMVDGVLANINDSAEPLIEKSRTEHIVFNCVVAEPGRKKITIRGHLVYEIIHTEETYLNDLGVLIDYFEPKFREKKIFDDNDIHSLFRDIVSIRQVHKEFYEQLKNIKPCYGAIMSGVFLCNLTKFKKATPFVSSFKRFDEMIKDKRTSSRSIDKAIKEIEKNYPGFTGRDFLSYYITPVQRYPRYPLLFRDLDKNTPNFHPDKHYLAMTAQRLTAVNKEIDSISHRVSQITQMQNIQDLMPEGTLIMTHGREIIETANIRIVGKKSGQGALYLFNDLIMLCMAKKKLHTPIYERIPIKFSFANCKPQVNSLYIHDRSDAYQLDFADPTEKSQWMDAYNQLLREQLSVLKNDDPHGFWTAVELTEGVPELASHAGTVSNGCAWFFGGTNESLSPLSCMLRYNIGDSLWTVEKTSVPPRFGHTLSAIHGDLIVAFGTRKKALKDIWMYATASREWREVKLKENVTPRYQHSAVVHEDTVVFYGGMTSNNKYIGSIAVFDPRSGLYKETPAGKDWPAPRAGHAAVMVGGHKMAIIGGRTAEGVTGEVWVLDLKRMKWSLRSQANVGNRQDHHCCVLENRFIFVIGGLITPQQGRETVVIDSKSWTLIPFRGAGCRPPRLCKQAVVALDAHRLMSLGGLDRSYRRMYPSAWILDISQAVHQLLAAAPTDFKKYWHRERISRRQSVVNKCPEEIIKTESEMKPAHDDTDMVRIPLQKREMSQPTFRKEEKPSPVKEIQKDDKNVSNDDQKIQKKDDKIEKEKKEVKIEKKKTDDKKDEKRASFNGPHHPPAIPTKEEIEKNIAMKERSKSYGGKEGTFAPNLLEEIRNVQKKKIEAAAKAPINRALSQPAVQIAQPPKPVWDGEVPPNVRTGPKFDAAAVFAVLGIDVSKLNVFQQRAASMKALKLWQRQGENDELAAAIGRYSGLLSGHCDPPPGTPILLKVFDDATRRTRLLKIDASADVAHIAGLVGETVGRADSILTVSIGGGGQAELHADSLKEALRSVYKGEMHCLTVSAL